MWHRSIRSHNLQLFLGNFCSNCMVRRIAKYCGITGMKREERKKRLEIKEERLRADTGKKFAAARMEGHASGLRGVADSDGRGRREAHAIPSLLYTYI